MKKTMLFWIIVLMLGLPSAFAQEVEGDLQVGGFEVEKLLNFGSGLLALGIFGATLLAYKRTDNKRLLYVSVAFLLFAIKGLFTGHELFMEELPGIDPIASALNFAIILIFFFAVVKK